MVLSPWSRGPDRSSAAKRHVRPAHPDARRHAGDIAGRHRQSEAVVKRAIIASPRELRDDFSTRGLQRALRALGPAACVPGSRGGQSRSRRTLAQQLQRLAIDCEFLAELAGAEALARSGGGVGPAYGRERRHDGGLDCGVSLARFAAEIAEVRYDINVAPVR